MAGITIGRGVDVISRFTRCAGVVMTAFAGAQYFVVIHRCGRNPTRAAMAAFTVSAGIDVTH